MYDGVVNGYTAAVYLLCGLPPMHSFSHDDSLSDAWSGMFDPDSLRVPSQLISLDFELKGILVDRSHHITSHHANPNRLRRRALCTFPQSHRKDGHYCTTRPVPICSASHPSIKQKSRFCDFTACPVNLHRMQRPHCGQSHPTRPEAR